MKSLIYKEFNTVLKPYIFSFALMTILLLVPGYPYFICFAFVVQGIYLYFNETRINNDLLFTSLLPISRKQIVLIKHAGVLFLEVITVVLAIPFAILSSFVVNPIISNIAGLDANMTLFGCVLFEYALFNLIFLPNYFKTAQKIGVPILGGLITFIVLQVTMEVLIGVIPEINHALEGVSPQTTVYRAIVLVIGSVAFIISGIVSYKLSSKNFERVGL